MRFQSTHVMARANHIELPVFMLARLRLKRGSQATARWVTPLPHIFPQIMHPHIHLRETGGWHKMTHPQCHFFPFFLAAFAASQFSAGLKLRTMSTIWTWCIRRTWWTCPQCPRLQTHFCFSLFLFDQESFDFIEPQEVQGCSAAALSTLAALACMMFDDFCLRLWLFPREVRRICCISENNDIGIFWISICLAAFCLGRQWVVR